MLPKTNVQATYKRISHYLYVFQLEPQSKRKSACLRGFAVERLWVAPVRTNGNSLQDTSNHTKLSLG